MSFSVFMTHFPFILLCLTVVSGLIYLADILFFAKKRIGLASDHPAKKMPWITDYARSFFAVFLLVFIIRSFIGQPYSVPTGSLEPTVKPGDLILVTSYSYGIKFPIWDKMLIPISNPKRGDIVVFHWPVNPQVDFVKRLIGIPGDHISYIHSVLYVNGKEAKQTYVGTSTDSNSPGGRSWPVKIMQENFLGVKHQIYACAGIPPNACPFGPEQDFKDLVVPKGEYLMMGDNRIDSDDSRDWGFVPRKTIIGKGQVVILSWDSQAKWYKKITFARSGERLNPHFFKF